MLSRLVPVALIALLSLAPPARADEDLTLELSKDRVSVGGTQCLNAVVTNDRGLPVNRALVLLDAKRKRTNGEGEARVCAKFLYEGAHAVRAYKGDKYAYKRVTARHELPGAADGEWKRLEIQLPAYPSSDGYCSGAAFGDGEGTCFGTNSAESDTLFFGGSDVLVEWLRPNQQVQTLAQRLVFEATNPVSGRTDVRLHGALDDARSDKFFVGSLWIDTSEADRFHYQAGSDPRKTGARGGPPLFSVTPHKPFDSAPRDGYTFQLKGYFWRTVK
jgi:hypothetical protein